DMLGIGRPMYMATQLPNILLKKSDLKRLHTAYDLVNAGSISDRTINRALHRYFLSRQRTDLMDKVIDLVIAWEALLLTHRGGAIFQELSYRFSLNGASIISKLQNTKPEESYKRMKSAYAVRSAIVHGAEQEDIDKSLRAGEFSNLNDLCVF